MRKFRGSPHLPGKRIRGSRGLPGGCALGYAPPAFAHLPLILAPTGGKLSKRNADKLGIPVMKFDGGA